MSIRSAAGLPDNIACLSRRLAVELTGGARTNWGLAPNYRRARPSDVLGGHITAFACGRSLATSCGTCKDSGSSAWKVTVIT